MPKRDFETEILDELETTKAGYFPGTVAKKLKCSDETAARYLAMLQREGKIEKIDLPRCLYVAKGIL